MDDSGGAVGPPDVAPTAKVDAVPTRREEIRALIRRSQLGAESKFEELEARRGASAPIDVAFQVVEADRRVAGGLISGGMAFRIFVVIVPFAFVLVTVLGGLGELMAESDPVALAKTLGMTGLVASSISASVESSTIERVATLLAASYALLWGTWSLIRAARAVHGLAWGLNQLSPLRRPWRPTLLVIAGMLSVFFVGVGIGQLSEVIGLVGEVAVRLLAGVGIIVAWLGVSSVLPRAEGTTWRSLVPGAVFFGVGVEVLQFLTVYFFSRYITGKTETYGAIGAALAILLWAYLGGRLIVASAFINAARWHQSSQANTPDSAATDSTNRAEPPPQQYGTRAAGTGTS